ncbi:multiple sugar transport system permease protein [Kineococcus radiotolerans]|uniref:Multiple sugar transport system permease protein n=1 Tax=Kineococcus radiotolerans TaxID=131568 RepID=A0A7W4TK37_KINRA|nr:carbohydrate ABC transporter permease [Kineococcus radiotolerans]MBB2900355.1 multiple sugar transport system permease protein [Kineococcus radiotolerans]
MATIDTSGSRRSGVSVAAPRARVAKPGANGGRTFNRITAVVLGIFAVIWLIPSLWAIKTSFTDNAVSALGTQAILKDVNPTLASYSALLGGGDLWNWYLASFITSTLSAALVVVFASMAAFAISRMRFRGRNVVFVLLLAGIMVPADVLIIPIFQLLNSVGLLNTYWAVIFPQVSSVIALFVFKQFFDGLPKELEEAARLDGATNWRIYRSVIMPLSRPVLSAMAIVTFVGVWNNLILPLYVLSNPDLMTIPVGLATVQGSFGQRFSDIQASTILGALPLVVLFLVFQRRIVEGVAGTGLKG